jgi:hypothetical protein
MSSVSPVIQPEISRGKKDGRRRDGASITDMIANRCSISAWKLRSENQGRRTQPTHGYLPSQFFDAVLEEPAEQEKLNRRLRRPNQTPPAKTQTDGTLHPSSKSPRSQRAKGKKKRWREALPPCGHLLRGCGAVVANLLPLALFGRDA